jgi:hypothetical protein
MYNAEETELQNLIRGIVRRVLAQLPSAGENLGGGTLMLAPAWIPDPEPVRRYCSEHALPQITAIGEGARLLGESVRLIGAETQQERADAMALLAGAGGILLVNPTLELMKSIVSGNDEGFYEQLFLRALLWGKNAAVLLDYEKPKFRRGTFFQALNDALGAIEEMGAQVVHLGLAAAKAQERLTLVTERDVIDAYRAHQERIACAAGAIITPLARDTAKELGLYIQE